MNTDELGTVKPFAEEPVSEDDGEDEAGAEAEDDARAAAGEETKQEAPAESAAAPMMINTGEAPAASNGEAGAEGKNEEESYEQEALNYLSLALQIIGDFSSENNCLEAQRAERKKAMAFLQIDTLLSRVQLFNHATDYNSVLEDLNHVVGLCEAYPEKNEQTLNSAIFQVGRAHMELKDFE